MTVQKTEQFTKRVRFKEANEDRQIATGVVMVPNKADLQGDYERPDTIRDLAEGFMGRLSAPDKDGGEGGVMHAAFADHSTLVENTVLDASREIAGEEFPAGTWIQSWKFDDSELWTLVRDDILQGYSIGAKNVKWSDPMAQDELPDGVSVAADYPNEEPVWELVDADIKEVSAVDRPAVPDALIYETKADGTEKRVADYLGDREGFMEEMAERGHSEGEAERLWNYLQRAADQGDVEASAGWLQRAKEFFTQGPGAEKTHSDTSETTASDGGDDGGTEAAADMTDEDNPMEEAPKWAQALHNDIEENSKRIEDALEANDGGGEKNAGGDGSGDGEGSEKDADDPMAEAPEWAKALKAETEKNAQRIDDVAKASGASQQIDGAGASGGNRKYSSDWDKTFGLPGGDA